ncbi:hypothetical protein M8998_10100 [Sphingobacterium sp. lm-10]|nr:hypothetical protein [Sphingobacterium sp. lm-10]MCL7988289.1 hypothetical protein [Sphingobacterium sp. lm-10]
MDGIVAMTVTVFEEINEIKTKQNNIFRLERDEQNRDYDEKNAIGSWY